MPKSNHQRLNAKRRIIAANARAQNNQREPEQSDYVWHELQFGKHKGKTLPWIVLNDPSYFYWLIREGIPRGSLGHQAAIVAGRAAHILPPAEYRDSAFRIVLNDFGDLVGFRFDKPGQHLLRADYATPHLNLKIIMAHVGKPSTAGRLLLRSFKQYYFRGRTREWSSFCDAFFRDDENFSLICTGDHCRIPSGPRSKRRKRTRKNREVTPLDCSMIQV